MKWQLHALDLDLLIEHRGYQARVKGSGRHFVAKFPTLLALFHFLRILWPSRKQLPDGFDFQMEWRGLRFPPKH